MVSMKLFQKILFASFAFLFTINIVFTQTDAHYWTHQYGAKGLLLNGSVIAATDDETAVYYNPGAMGNGEDFGVSLTFFTPSYSLLKTSNYLGEGTNLKNKNFAFTPGFLAIGFKLFKNNKIRTAFTSFTRFRSNLGSRSRESGLVKDKDEFLFIGNLDFSRKLTQRWIGLGMAYRFSDNLSLGFTQFAAIHKESALLSIQKEIVTTDDPYELFLSWRSKVKYKAAFDGGLLTKFGLSTRIKDVKIGLVATTPIYKYFFGRASYDLDDLKVFSANDIQIRSNFKGADLQYYQTPLSIGLGLDFKIQKTRISFSSEYFAKVKPYTLISDYDDPFDGEATEEFLDHYFVQSGEKAVLNVAIGLQTEHHDNMTLIWGFRTDFNHRLIDPSSGTLSFLGTSPDIFHISCGGFFSAWSNKFSIGLDYAWGRKTSRTQVVDLNNITAENLFTFSGTNQVETRYQALTLVLTYDFIVKSWKDRRRRLAEERRPNF
jgi:hypothetical protein